MAYGILMQTKGYGVIWSVLMSAVAFCGSMQFVAITSATMITRFLPFLLFPENKKTPQIVFYLGNVLPAAMMGLLVVYCLKNISLWQSPHGLPEFLAIALVVLLHRWKNNVLLSIGSGTIFYMISVQFLL